ncbi:MAG: hypothetical protein GXO86_04220, partial [Chlorobi bacterium]|nr:hypothetical protein [Chlorobiota bacterium]
MKRFCFILFLFLSFGLYAQDTLTVLQYNLLNYGNITGYCNNSNNNINDKDKHLKKIINYIKPDIFTVNEMSKSPAIHQHLLDKVLNTGGVGYYRKASFLSVAESDLVNMLYYNSKKLRFHSHVIAQSYIRDIDVYKLYYYSNDLEQGDTAFVICVVAHLKASTGLTNSNKRKVMAQNTMNYLNNYDDDNNYMMMGDFNLYSDEEPAYIQFLYYSNPSLRFFDPINQSGPWHNNYTYRNIHTQSTHTESSGCASTGGMDDRFDFILISGNIKNGSKNVKYIPGTYHAVGQDGKHFNSSLISSPANTSVPSDVLYALYYNSDHLPVTLKLAVDKTLGMNEWENSDIEEVRMVNPVDNELKLFLSVKKRTDLKVDIISITGRVLLSKQLPVMAGQTTRTIPVSGLPPGL